MPLNIKTLKEKKWWIIIIGFLFLFCVYVVVCFRYGPDQSRIDLGTLAFPTALTFIVLFWNLEETKKASDKQIAELHKATVEQIEVIQKSTQNQINALKDSTKQQVDSFAVQCQGIVNALENVIGALGEMSENFRKQLEAQEKEQRKLEEAFRQVLLVSQREARLKMDEKQRMTPRIFIRIAQEPFLLFFQHYKIYIFNTGGLTRKLNLTYVFVNPPYKSTEISVSLDDLNRDKQARPIDCGDISTFTAYHSLEVYVHLRDKEDRLYVGSTVIDKTYKEWTEIKLQERVGE